MQNLDYKDVYLAPKYSDCESRSTLIAEVSFLGRLFKSPAMPANMKACISFNKAVELSQSGHFYVLHRFYDYKDIFSWISNSQHLKTISISIGVKDKDYKLLESINLARLRVDFVTIDVASGHNILVKNIIHEIKNQLPNAKIIAGNIGTLDAAKDLKNWGADALKVGLGYGAGCTTYNNTGVGTPMFSTLIKLKDNIDIPYIADGGVREIGDICKALVAGSSMVMIGSGFASCQDSPAETLYEQKIVDATTVLKEPVSKVYFGSASKENGNSNYVEGKSVILPITHPTYGAYYKKIKEGVASCMSYAGVYHPESLHLMEWEVYTK